MSTLRGKENGVDSSGDLQRGARGESKERAEPIGARRGENEERREERARGGGEKHMAGINYLPFMYNKKMHFNYRKSTKSTQ